MKRIILTLCIFFAGFSLFDAVLPPSKLGIPLDILGFVGGLVLFFLLSWLGGFWATETNSRRIFENGFLLDKVKKEVERAISMDKNVVNIVVNKVYHPSGVYYNVHAE